MAGVKAWDGLPPTIGGGAGMVQRAACGDSKFIPVRVQADGTIANVETVCTTQIPDGAIYVGGCTCITMLMVVEKGSLTSATIKPTFSDTRAGTYYPYYWLRNDTALTATQTITTNGLVQFLFAADFLAGGVFTFPIPAMNWMKISTLSSGTVTSSYAIISVSRGWGHVPHVLSPS